MLTLDNTPSDGPVEQDMSGRGACIISSAKGEMVAASLTNSVIVAGRFHGPPKSGNGGYVCGLAARFIDGPAEATLRAPPPLDAVLAVAHEGVDVVLRHGAQEIARARPATPQTAPPASPGLAQAERASLSYRGRDRRIFPTCFVCGPEHQTGLHIFAGPAGDALVAAPWTPHSDLAAADGLLAAEFLWAALDCPTYWALPQAGTLTAVLARLTAAIDKRPATGDRLVIAAWPLGADGRKHRSASAVYDEHGVVLARAEALWIEVRPEQFG
jgi:hypothetical protein